MESEIAGLVAQGELAGAADDLIEKVEQVAASSNDAPTIAFAYRLIGEIHEHLGTIPAALEAFDIALQYDLAVGVKRKAAKLRKELAAGKEQTSCQ